MNIIFQSGYYGVMAFFVVSGFLITSNAIRKWGTLSNIKPDQFYLMRFARIIPCLAALLIILSILDRMQIIGFTIKTSTLWHALFSAATFHINWLEAKTGYLPANWDVLWSLSVEEMFYLFFPLLCVFLKNRYQFISLLVIFIVLGPIVRNYYADNDFWSDHGYLSCMDGIAIGCLAAIFASNIKMHRLLNNITLLVGLWLFSFIFFFRHEAFFLGLSPIGLNNTVLEIGIALILIATQHQLYTTGKSAIQLTVPVRWYGRNSYEVYLTHSFIVVGFENLIYRANQSVAIIALEYISIVILSGMVGQCIAKYFSEPMNRKLRNATVIKTQLIEAT